MYWKMSIDLTRPLVPSMGQHDPLDGLVTCSELLASAKALGLWPRLDLRGQIDEMAAICQDRGWISDDPLGIGGLLWDAWRIVQLLEMEIITDTSLLESVVSDALAGLAGHDLTRELNAPAQNRLAFRELGLSIGLKGVVSLQHWSRGNTQAGDS